MRWPNPVASAAAGGLATYLLARLFATAEAWFIFSTSLAAKVVTPAPVAAVVTSARILLEPNVNKTRSPAVSPVAVLLTACAPACSGGGGQLALGEPGTEQGDPA